jgi:hypothetical protein
VEERDVDPRHPSRIVMMKRRQTPKPRDLGLLLWCLLYRVPIEEKITKRWIEAARKHCRMSPERLTTLRQGMHARHWCRLRERRARRLIYFRKHGEIPHGWTPPAPGEQDRSKQVQAMRLYWHTRAKAKARIRKRPKAATAKLTNAYFAARRIRSKARRSAAMDMVEMMLYDQILTNAPEVSFRQWQDMQGLKAMRVGEYLKLSRGTKVATRAKERKARGTRCGSGEEK